MSSVSNTRRLRSLLAGAKADQKLTLDAIVERSEGRLRRSYASNLTKELYRRHPLTREELVEIADAFGVDYEVLRQAHLDDMGLQPREGTDAPAIALELPPGTDALTAKQRSAVLAVIRAMVDPADADDHRLTARTDPDSTVTILSQRGEGDADEQARAERVLEEELAAAEEKERKQRPQSP